MKGDLPEKTDYRCALARVGAVSHLRVLVRELQISLTNRRRA